MKRLLIAALLLAGAVDLHAQGTTAAIDSLSPVFVGDSAKTSVIRSIENGKVSADSGRKSASVVDSLEKKLRRRGVFVGATLAFSFGNHSAKDLFSGEMNARAAADSGTSVLQPQDPVHIFFPAGLLIGFPVFPYLDVWLREESFWYRVSGLTQRPGYSTQEFWYTNQGHFAGVGARYHVPITLLSVNGEPGLYAAYTRFWNFGPTGIRTSDGSLRAKTDPGGAGYEVQVGFQQDFDKRWTFTGGLAFSSLSFASNGTWKSILPNAGPDEPAQWTLRSARFSLQGLYQFGRKN